MKPMHLLVQELNYELRIRGIITDRKDASQKRKMLARILERDRYRVNVDLADPDYDFDEEKRIIDETIESIKSVIVDFEGPETDSTHKRIISRIIHVTERVKRIAVPADDGDRANEIKTYKNESLASCLELEILLSEKVRNDADLMRLSNVNENSFNQQPLVQNIVQTSPKSIPVYKWNIQFSGDRNSNNLDDFLERVEELCVARHVDKKELFESAVELFTGNALIWFRSIKSTVGDWDALVSLLKREFLAADHVDCVWEQIRKRMQGPSEPIHIYVAAMENLFSRLGHFIAESTKLKYLRKNMNVRYIQQLALVPINSIADLVHYCKKIDEAVAISRSQSQVHKVAEISSERNECLPGPSNRFNHNSSVRETNTFKSHRPGANKPDVHKSVVCWNCNQPNHTFNNCTARWTKFCYRCGRPGFTTRTCSCSKNEF